MRENSKLVSFLLALVMILGMVIPYPIHADVYEENLRTYENDNQEANYTIDIIDGVPYQFYNYTDLVDIDTNIGKDVILMNEDHMFKSFKDLFKETMNEDNKYSPQAVGDPIPEAKWYPVSVDWGTFDLKPADMGFEIKAGILDKKSRKVIAETKAFDNLINEKKTYEFQQLDKWYESDVSHDPKDWVLFVPKTFSADIRLKTATGGTFSVQKSVEILVSQRALPIYKVEYHTNNNKPNIELWRTNPENTSRIIPTNTDNIGDSYYSFAVNITSVQKYNYNGKEVDVQEYGTDTWQSLEISDQLGADRVKTYAKVPGSTEYSRGPGEFTNTDDIRYFYVVTGDYKTPHITTVRQQLEVKFNTGKGSLVKDGPANQDIGNAQIIGHGEKFSNNDSGRTITLPDVSGLIPPNPAKNGDPKNEFKGWATTADATTVLFKDQQSADSYTQPFTDDSITFYAIYGPKAQGKVNVKYVDLKTNAEIKEAEEKEEDLDTEVTTPDVSKAPEIADYACKSVTIEPATNAKYTDPATATITYGYKKKVVTEDPQDPDYVKVDFATTKGTVDGQAKYWVLKGEEVTFAVPTVDMGD
ncbi:MAG: hypothetical protein SOZ40_07090, partial [Ezakiella sp.]|nr:hypothetical protein [Ezakiella sp.]